jgi:hypothetical protein
MALTPQRHNDVNFSKNSSDMPPNLDCAWPIATYDVKVIWTWYCI